MTVQIRYDDLADIRPMITDTYSEWGPELRVTQAMIDGFADLTGDHQWIHVDVERAKHGPFGTTIAHGFLTLSLMPGLRGPSPFEIVGHGSVLNYGSDGLRFLSPVRSGDSIHLRSRLAAVDKHPRGTKITTEIAVHVVGSDQPSLIYRAITLYTPPA